MKRVYIHYGKVKVIVGLSAVPRQIELPKFQIFGFIKCIIHHIKKQKIYDHKQRNDPRKVFLIEYKQEFIS